MGVSSARTAPKLRLMDAWVLRRGSRLWVREKLATFRSQCDTFPLAERAVNQPQSLEATDAGAGGAIRLAINGTLTVGGSLTANGNDGQSGPCGEASGGGSGGSIYVTTGTLTGSGVVSANGGDGGSGGGRIAVSYGTSTFAGTFSACGGLGYAVGGAGTIFTKSIAQESGDLLVDNCGNSGGFASATSTEPVAFDSVTATNQGKLDLEVPTLTVGALTASDGGVNRRPSSATELRPSLTGFRTMPSLARRGPLTCHQFVTKMPLDMLSMRNMQSCFGVPKVLCFL